jgi:hypothetical protein
MNLVTRCYPIARRSVRSRASHAAAQAEVTREDGVDNSRASRIARLLALAHCIERQCANDVIADYAEASRRLGMTHARMSQVMNLLHLSPTIQQRILDGSLATTERSLRTVACLADWQLQLERRLA